jgi:RNA polymerase sigma factor (sigma-70 family)
VQTTFLKTWQYLQKTGKIELMRAFLYHVLNGLIIDEYRKNKPVSLELLSDDGNEVGVNITERLFDIIDAKGLGELIKKLPPKYQGAITMRYIKEMTLKEMSAATHESENTMSVQVHRGLIKLRALQALG